MLAGYVTEKMAPRKGSWEDIVRRHIFDALGMKSTTFVENLKENTDMVSPYAYMDGRLQKLDRLLLELVRHFVFRGLSHVWFDKKKCN